MGLEECIQQFLTTETLKEEEKWYCNRCKLHVRATKKFDLWRCPRLLIIHLKRFQFSIYNRRKLSVKVDFPVNGLSLAKHIIGDQQTSALYDLFAVSNHMGDMGGGHYTASAKNITTGRWFNFDDSNTFEIGDPEHDIVNGSAYVLFYALRDPPPLPGQVRFI